MIDLIKGNSKQSDKLESYIDKKSQKTKILKKIGSHDNDFMKKEGQLFNLNLKVTNTNNAYIENSLHTFFNRVIKDENHNYDDFHFCDLVCSINILEDILKTNLHNFSLQNLEIGFNIDIGSCPTKFLEENLLMYRLKDPCVNQKNDMTLKQKIFVYQNYKFKIYDKSLESKIKILKPNILRIEVKYLTSKEFNKFGIFNICDLKDLNKIKLLFDDFIDKFEKLTIIDSYKGNLSTCRIDRGNLIKYTNPNYWNDTRVNSSKGTFYNRMKRFNMILESNNLLTIKNRLRELIIEKYNYLANPDCNDNIVYESLIA